MANPFIAAVIRGKARREGASSHGTCIQTHIATFGSNKRIGNISKTGNDVEDLFENMIVPAFKALPIFLRPRTDNPDDPKAKTGFNFKRPSSKKKVKGIADTSRKGLNSIITTRDTTLNAYDSGRWSFIMVDECFSPDTKVMVEGGLFKPVKDIQVGDNVIVEGGKVVEVANKFYGQDNLYLVKQPYSKDYIVSSKHRLYLEQRCNTRSIKDDGIKYYTPEQFISLEKYRKRTTYGIRSEGVHFDEKNTIIDPYVFGVWIGDGFKSTSGFVLNKSSEPELFDFLKKYGEDKGYRISDRKMPYMGKMASYLFYKPQVAYQQKANPFLEELRRLGVLNNKSIPDDYLFNSKENRLKVLAGIIDTDGHCDQKKNAIYICLSDKNIVNQVVFLARSVGLSVSEPKVKNTNHGTVAFRIGISGDLSSIPTLIKRKQFIGYTQKYKFRRNRIEVEPIGVGNYVGIQIKTENEDDRRLILEDFTISMNCGKWLKVNTNKYWSILKQTLVKGASKVGFAYLPSTVNPPKDGGNNFKLLYDMADQFKYPLNKLPKQMVKYFKPAYDGLAGFIDQFGDSVIDPPDTDTLNFLVYKNSLVDDSEKVPEEYLRLGAKAYLAQRLALLEDEDDISEEKRMYPTKEADMFDFGESVSPFNIGIIEEQEKWLQNNPQPLRRGRFVWNPIKQKVEWYDDNKGLWYVSQLLDDGLNNRWTKDGRGIVRPGNGHNFGGGVDTFRFDKTVELGSKGSIWVGSKLDVSKEDGEDGGDPVAKYLGRPKLTELFWKEILLAGMYYGCTLTVEKDATQEFIKYFGNTMPNFMDANCLPMLGKKPDVAIDKTRTSDYAKKDSGYGASSADPFVFAKQIEICVIYIEKYCHKIKFPSLLAELKVFDPSNRTKFDESIGFMMMLLNICGDFQQRKKEKPKAKKFVQYYNVS